MELGVFSEQCTEKLPLRVDFIHRVEFGEEEMGKVVRASLVAQPVKNLPAMQETCVPSLG